MLAISLMRRLVATISGFCIWPQHSCGSVIAEQATPPFAPQSVAPTSSAHGSGQPLRWVLPPPVYSPRSEEHTSELQSRPHLVCRLLLEKKKKIKHNLYLNYNTNNNNHIYYI